MNHNLAYVLVKVATLIDKKVIGRDGYIVGDMKGLEADTSNWQISHMQVKLTNQAAEEMGFKKIFRRSSMVCIPVSYVAAIGDIITVS